MTRYTADSRDRVLDAVDMVALVSDRTELTRRGVDSYFGLCPFHDERTGSFHVSPDEKLYHCFGCQASGGPFRFVMETQGLDFTAAIEVLAARFGVALETEAEDPAAATRRQRRERLHALLDRAAIYYARYLWESGDRGAAAARDYLLGRGLEESTLREFRVGYAPSAWDRILLASRRAGYSDEELLAVGLASRSRSSPGQIFDRFRDRIMFPAVDARGRVLGFGARRMRENQDPAKYLNTAEGEIYHKRELLFGIDLARAAAARAGRMILVEGYTDVLALHQAGIRNAVGIMGTSLTEEQVSELERVVPTLELCLDADRAGQEAIVRAARLAAGHKLELRVVSMPEGTDPADLVEREGADSVRERLRGSAPFVAFNVERILARAETDTAEGRDRALAELGPVLEDVPPSVVRDDLVRRVAGRLELSEARLATLGRGGGGRSGGVPVAAGAIGQAVRTERLFLGLCLAVPEPGGRTLAEIDVDRLLTGGSMRRAARHLVGRTRRPLSDLPPEDEELARVIADLVALAGRIPDPSADRLEHALQLLELERLERAIIRARGEGAGSSELAVEREAVRDRLHQVGTRLEKTL
ncbi:MAG: DNA primase [Solirubrobacteraceae bacterium]